MSKFLIVVLSALVLHLYAIKGIYVVSQYLALPWRRIVFWGSLLIIVGVWAYIVYLNMNRREIVVQTHSYDTFNMMVGAFLIMLTTTLLFGLFHILSDLWKLGQFIIEKFKDAPVGESHEGMNRMQFFNQIGLVVSGLWLGANLWGVTKGRFSYRVEKATLKFPNLPDAFDGMRVVQISDLHLGSFLQHFDEVQEGFDMINALDADYVFFTGDLVNNFSDEAEPWIERLKGIKAKYGKFSILGNHDYGDYALREFPEEKAKSFQRLTEIHGEAGFRLLRNENVRLERNGQSIVLAGSENWGLGFHQYGDLTKTLEGTTEEDFKILLSHDPTHWQEHVIGDITDIKEGAVKLEQQGPEEPKDYRRTAHNIALTLSGHTHGAQFGVELPSLGIKFSPVQLRYKRWGGLYEEGGKYLYINRGFGYLAFPGRVGMPPEITLLEFRKA